MVKYLAMCAALMNVTVQAFAAKLLRFPDVSATHLSFVYGGDVYISDRSGGVATRLTSHVGQELFPKFSPDGQMIAFSAEYNGTRQVYVMPINGSIGPKQLTWYNDVGPMPPRGGYDYRILDWSKDGKKILVRMNRLGFDERAGKPYWVPVEGGDEQPLIVPETGGGMLSPDNRFFVYTPIDREFRTWKRTRGGRAQDVWLFDLKNESSLRLTDHRATDNQPMWLDGKVYFTSDRNYTLNLFSIAPETAESSANLATQVTQFKQFDVLWPSAGPDAIAFENGGDLYIYTPKDQRAQKIDIEIQGDFKDSLPSVKNVVAQIESTALSAGAERAIISARGDIFSVPRKNGVIRNLTRSPDHREMAVTLSPDGKSIAYFSDKSGEYELYVQSIDASSPAEVKRLSKNGRAWKSNPIWAPDGKSILVGDSENRLLLYTLGGDEVLIDQSTRARAIGEYLFTPDAKHVVYVKANAASINEIWWFNRQSGNKQRILGGQFDASLASIDPSGRYLYFTSNRDHNLQFSSYEFNYIYTNATRLFVTSLNASTPALLPLQSDEINQSKAVVEAKVWDTAKTLDINLDGIESRTEALNVGSGNYPATAAVLGGLYFLSQTSQTQTDLKFFDLKTQRVESIAANVSAVQLNSSGTHALLRIGEKWIVAELKPAADLSQALDLNNLTMRIEPKREWAQMYKDGMRVFREWFYDAGMHGNDWEALEKRYEPLASAARTRADLDYVFGEIAGELNAGHIYVDRGDEPKAERRESGLLGAEFERQSNGYRVTKIFPGQNWSEEFRAPLRDVGVDVRVGDIITSINGVKTTSVENFYQLLEGTGAKMIELERLRDGQSKRVLVKTTTAETNLRYLEWIQSRAAMVDRLSQGQIGYVHLPNTAAEGNRELFKQFPSQIQKKALIIDDRYNGGGFIPDRLIEILARKPLNYWKRRGLEPEATPLLSHNGPKAMLTNGLSSSGGDALPYYFRKLGLGKVIGTRTWGGLIGISGNPRLADGAQLSAATFRILSTDNEWVVENEGVAPDIEVIDRPDLLAKGQDPSLERAVQELLKELQESPRQPVKAPPAPSDFGRLR
jgi:tricorn protease